MNKMKIVSFMTVMVLLAVSIAVGIYAFTTYREGGIFDGGFRGKAALESLTSTNEEVLEGLPSTTVKMEADISSPSVSPVATLEEAGRLISLAVRDSESDVSSQVTNIHYRAATKDLSEYVDFKFNASTPVDYSDDTYQKSLGIFNVLSGMKFQKMSLVSSPTPDGERSIDAVVYTGASTDTRGYDVASEWTNAIVPMGRAVNDSNLSSLTLISGERVALEARFYDEESFERARTADANLWSPLVSFSDSTYDPFTIEEARYIMSPLGASDDSLNIKLSSKVETEGKFESITTEVMDKLGRNKEFTSILSNRIVFTVDGNPNFRKVIPGKTVNW